MALTMASPTRNKNGVFTTRVVVPKELRSIIGKTELKRSLNTKEERDARLRHPVVLAEFQAEVERARRQLESNNELTDTLISVVLFNWKKRVLSEFHTSPSSMKNYLMLHEEYVEGNDLVVLQILDDIEVLERTEQARAFTDAPLPLKVKQKRLLRCFEQLDAVFGSMLEEDLASFGVTPHISSANYQKLLMTCANEYVKLAQTAVKKYVCDVDIRAHGFADTTELMSLPSERTLTLMDVWEEYQQAVWRREPDRAGQRIRDYSTAVNKLLKMYPEKPICKFSKGDIARFRNILEQLPSRPKKEIAILGLEVQIRKAKELGLKVTAQASVKKQLQAISAVFTYAVQQDYLQTNPVHGASSGIKIAKSKVLDKHYTDEEIVSIFTSKLFTSNFGPEKADYGFAHYWLPLMLYYTGARAEELAQLYIGDIKLDVEIPYIEITDARADQSIKTGESRRVPIHEHLLELGFADYLNTQPLEGRLFPNLHKPKNGKYHVKVSLWFGKFISNELGIHREGLRPYHAFRHTFITGCRQRNVRLDIQNAITGHSQSDTASQYGAYPLPAVNEVIQSIPRCF
ncbi:DUF6538 domain-containing protein [Vibrio breoganii]